MNQEMSMAMGIAPSCFIKRMFIVAFRDGHGCNYGEAMNYVQAGHSYKTKRLFDGLHTHYSRSHTGSMSHISKCMLLILSLTLPTKRSQAPAYFGNRTWGGG